MKDEMASSNSALSISSTFSITFPLPVFSEQVAASDLSVQSGLDAFTTSNNTAAK